MGIGTLQKANSFSHLNRRNWCVFALMFAAAPVLGADHPLFTPPVSPVVPDVRDADWVRTPVDAFILARLEREKLTPTAPADRITLLRRVTFDLTGLPPTPEHVDAFLDDREPDAYERLVERLLASPRYGEQWAQHWLDVVRYADSDGFEYDAARPHAWRYRDWVIRTFNEDMPYDRFIREQIAGDELSPDDPYAAVATGLHRLGPLRLSAGNQDEEKNRQEVLTEMLDILGPAFLGVTLGCVRCHDHKFDPFSQVDYYQLQAFFAGTVAKDIPLATEAEQAAHEKKVTAWKERVADLQAKIATLEKPVRTRLVAAKKAELGDTVQKVTVSEDEVAAAMSPTERNQCAELRAAVTAAQRDEPAPLPAITAVAETGTEPPATHVLNRGEPGKRLQQVHPAFPIALSGSRTSAQPGATGRRSALAAWITSKDHPLTARVMVNRIWQHHFGRGIVATTNDFGAMGTPPTHPALLDWLATEFVARGWSIKAMHRLVVNSATYRQASRAEPRSLEHDPDNQLWSRMARRRLRAEELRDSVLAVAGTLNPKQGGPGVKVPLSEEVGALIYKGVWLPTRDPAEHTRRTVYLFLKRNVRPPLLECFDAPSTMVSCGTRNVSTHTGQSLAMMNSALLGEQSWALAARVMRETDGTPSAMIDRAYRLTLARPARDDERDVAGTFLRRQSELLEQGVPPRSPTVLPDGVDAIRAAALADLCLVLFNLHEFVYVN